MSNAIKGRKSHEKWPGITKSERAGFFKKLKELKGRKDNAGKRQEESYHGGYWFSPLEKAQKVFECMAHRGMIA